MSIHRYLVLILNLLLVVACDNEVGRWVENDFVPAVFTPDLSGVPHSRATNDTWTADDRVGIYMLNGSNYALTAALKKNIEYKATAGTSATLTPVLAANTIYYPVNGETVRFVAYSPYLSSASTANEATYTFTTQNKKDLKESKDFIFYRGTTDRSKANATETMKFKHKFSKINISVKQGTNGPSCSGLTMTLTKMPLSATVNLATLASSATNENAISGLGISTSNTTISAYTSASTPTSASVEAIVAPHTGAGNFTGRTFTFSAGGYVYNLPNTVTFEAGRVYNFSFILTQTGAVLNEVKIDDWGVGEVQWNKDYALAASVSEIIFDPGASSQTLVVRTKGAATVPTINRSTSSTNAKAGVPNWLTSASFDTASTAGDWTTRTMTVTVTANTGSTNREGYIHVSFEGLSVVIKITQAGAVNQGDANCYIVTPGTSITIPLSRAVTYGKAPTNATFTAVKLWDDTAGGAVATVGVPTGTGASATLTITAGKTPGNALVAVQNNGVTYWSYHIWVTNYNPNVSNWINTYNTNNSGKHFVFMDRNLGALYAGTGNGYGTGLFYQWGRKDPFPATLASGETQLGGGTFTVLASSFTDGTVTNTIKNPTAFLIAGASSSNDWHWGATGSARSDRDDTLWGHGITTPKSVYDPCPAGWRVPSHNVTVNDFPTSTTSPWLGFSTSNSGTLSSGYIFGNNAQYPATGYRSNGSSKLYNPGTNGYYWSASPYTSASGSASYLGFGSSFISVNGVNSRACGLSVRCVLED